MRKFIGVLLTGVAFASVANGMAGAQTLPQVLAQTYANNHSLNVNRAQLRATDETVTQARSALRPQVDSTSQASAFQSRTTSGDRRQTSSARSEVLSSRIQISQTLFDGLRTSNNVRTAQSTVLAARANLENDVQGTLLDAATIYATVVRNRRVADLRRRNLDFLLEQVRASGERFRVGEGTRTDVAQTEAQQALATATLNSSLAEVATSEARYLQVVGSAPGALGVPAPPPQEATSQLRKGSARDGRVGASRDLGWQVCCRGGVFHCSVEGG